MRCESCNEEYSGGNCAQNPTNEDVQFGAIYACNPDGTKNWRKQMLETCGLPPDQETPER